MEHVTIVGLVVLGCFVGMFIFAAVMHSRGSQRAEAAGSARQVVYAPVPPLAPV